MRLQRQSQISCRVAMFMAVTRSVMTCGAIDVPVVYRRSPLALFANVGVEPPSEAGSRVRRGKFRTPPEYSTPSAALERPGGATAGFSSEGRRHG